LATPAAVRNAEVFVAQRNYTSAVREAQDALRECTSERQKALFAPRAKLALARAKTRLGEYAEGAKLAAELIAEKGESRYAPDAWVERVEALTLLSGQQEIDKVKGDVDKLKSDKDFVTSVGIPAIEAIEMALAGYYEKKGNTTEAKRLYSNHEGSQRSPIRERAKLGRARISMVEKQVDRARSGFQDLIDRAQDPDVGAGALVGLGDFELAQVEKTPAKDRPVALRRAAALFFRAVSLYVPTGSGASDNHENSLRKAGQCMEKIMESLPAGKPDSKDERARQFFANYARMLYEELIRSYPMASDGEDLRKKDQLLAKQDKQDKNDKNETNPK
jgi:hypothetical protein